MKGLVIKNTGSWYLVKTEDGRTIECKIKGNFRLKVRVLREDNTEVELGENIDYGDVDIRSILEGDSRRFNNNNDESFGDHGFSKQEFDGEELVDVSEDDDYDDDESVDADEDMGYDE